MLNAAAYTETGDFDFYQTPVSEKVAQITGNHTKYFRNCKFGARAIFVRELGSLSDPDVFQWLLHFVLQRSARWQACPGWVLEQALAARVRWLDSMLFRCQFQALATLPHTSAPFIHAQSLYDGRCRSCGVLDFVRTLRV